MTRFAPLSRTPSPHRGTRVAIALGVALASWSCGGDPHLRECKPSNPTRFLCTPTGLVGETFFPADLNPRVTPEWGCHFEVQGGELVAVGEGALCSNVNWDNYDFGGERHASFPRSCGIPPPGDWIVLDMFGKNLKVSVTETEFACSSR